jgi:hypothetical protein
MFNGTVVHWFSKKHNCVDKSTMEDEYASYMIAISDAVRIKRFVDRPINVLCDNQLKGQICGFKLPIYSRYSGKSVKLKFYLFPRQR